MVRVSTAAARHGTAPAPGRDRIAHTEATVIGTSPIEQTELGGRERPRPS